MSHRRSGGRNQRTGSCAKAVQTDTRENNILIADISFAASAGSGFSGTISTVQEMQPNAAVVEDGLHIPMGDVAGGREQIKNGFPAWKSNLRIRRIQRDEVGLLLVLPDDDPVYTLKK